MNNIAKPPIFPVFRPQAHKRIPVKQQGNARLPKAYFEALPQQEDLLKNKNIKPENFEPIFRRNLKDYVTRTEKLEKSAENKMTLMKALFVGLLILGIICAASFFLLPVLGSIAAALGISVTATMVAWQSIFLGGGLIAGLSFLPRRFIKGFEEDRNHYHQKAEILKHLLQEDNFRDFLGEELRKYEHHEAIAVAPDFAELYYLMQNLQDKKLDIQRFEQELLNVRNMIRGEANKELQENINKINEKLQQMQREVHELENEANDIRVNLAQLDKNPKA